MNCLSERQKRRFHEIENHILENNEDLADPATKQLYIVCLSYDEGIRYNIAAWLYNEPDIPRYVVVDSEKSCDCVAIQYSKSRVHWVFSIKPDIKFKTANNC